MKTDISVEMLTERVKRQLVNIADVSQQDSTLIDMYIYKALSDLEEALYPCRIKQTKRENGLSEFRTRHIGQYAMFLWFLGRHLYESGKDDLAESISYVNSSLNSVFLNHRVNMPKHFYLDHPMATVIGRAEIGDYFFCMQCCTVGGVQRNGQLIFPHLGSHVEMMSGSSVIGDCHVGDYVIFASHSLVKNRNIPNDCIVFGQDRDLVIRQYTHEEMLRHMTYF